MIGYDKKRKTYYVQYKWKDGLGKWHTTMKRGFPLKKEAQLYEAKMLTDTQTTAGNLTFKEINERFCDANQVSDEQRRKREVAFEKRFTDYYEKPIKKITKAQLDLWRSNLLQDNSYSTRIKNATIGFVKSVFTYASELYDIPNTASFLKSGKFTNEEIMNQEKPVWTVEQFNEFLDTFDDNNIYKLFFETLYWTGMRRGEAMALQKSDFDGKGINIHSSIKHFKNGLKPTKTRQSRYILLDDKLIKDIQPLLNVDGDFLFGGKRSLPISNIQREFANAKEQAGLKDKVTIHCLRHSHATWLINNGANIVAVSKRLGHSSIQTTLKTYAHLLQETDSQMMDLINNNHL